MFSERTNWPTEINDLTQVLQDRRQRGLPVADLTESNPTRCGFDYGSCILDAFLNREALRYAPDPRGPTAAREAVAEYYASRGAAVSPCQIFLTASTSEAYSYIFRLLGNPGDEVLIPSPGYPLFSFLTRLNDLEASAYPLVYEQGWRIGCEALQRVVSRRTRAVLVVHPNNPTGSYVHRDEVDFLVGCCKASGMALISDEVFADYAHASTSEAKRAPTFATEQRALTFTLSGISKISALPQMKCAWVVVSGPESLTRSAVDRMETIADTYLSLSTPVACALPELIKLRHRLQPQIRQRIESNLDRLDSLLGVTPVRRLTVEGGWYAILELPPGQGDEEWCLRLLREQGVLVHPGHFYDFAEDGYLVVSLLPPSEIFSDGVEKLHHALSARLRKPAY